MYAIRSYYDPDFDSAECAVIIRTDLREHRLATRMIESLSAVLAAQGARRAVLMFPERQMRIVNLARELGFEVGPAGDGRLRAVKPLRTP